MSSNARLLIADPQAVIREGLRCIVESRTTITVAGAAADGEEAVEMTARLKPQLLLIDMDMSHRNSLDVASYLNEHQPNVKLIGWSVNDNAAQAQQFFERGGAGYLHKNCTIDQLLQAFDRVLSGETYGYSSLRAGNGERGAMQENRRVITPREREVLKLIAEGHPTRDIASALCVSVKTVESHRKNIMDKLGLHSVAALTKYAVREGISTLDVIADSRSGR